jgi:hypothetical protein
MQEVNLGVDKSGDKIVLTVNGSKRSDTIVAYMVNIEKIEMEGSYITVHYCHFMENIIEFRRSTVAICDDEVRQITFNNMHKLLRGEAIEEVKEKPTETSSLGKVAKKKEGEDNEQK